MIFNLSFSFLSNFVPVFEVNSYTPAADTPSHVQCVLRQVLLEVALKCSVRSSGLAMRGDAELGGQAAPGIVPNCTQLMGQAMREQLWLQGVMWEQMGQMQPLPTSP